MAPGSLFPCSVAINYSNSYGRHKMTIPLNEWSPVSGGHIAGTNLAWDETQVDTDTMINGLVDLLKVFQPTDCTFTDYTISTYASFTDPGVPKVSKPIVTGVGTGGAVIPATQATYNFKTTGFKPFKIVLLDTRVSSDFGPLKSLVSPANDDEIALRDFIIDDANAFMGRQNEQPAVLTQVTYTLNEKLRKSYRLD